MSQNINALKLGFINYLKEISETTNKEYITTNSDVSIFMYANEFKNYISDELDIDPKILSMSINDILNMDIENGKLVDPDEEEKETGVETESSQDPDSIKDIPSQDNNIQGDPTQTGNNTTIQENGENQTTILNDDSIGQLLNTLFEEDAVKNIIDLDQNGELNEEEIFSFIDTIKGFDGDDENISLEDIISSLQAINEGELSLNKEVNDSNENDTEEAEQPIISQGTAGATNTSGVSGTRGNYGISSGNLGISNPSGNQTTQEKTLDNMSKEELNSELNSAQSDLSDKQNNLSAILNGSDSQIAQLQQNVDVAYDIYQEELKNLDEDLAKQVDELKSDIDNKENEIDNKEQEISNQESTVNNAKTAYNNAVSTTKTLKNSLSVLKSTDTSNMTPEQKAEINSKIADLEAKIRNSQKAEENAKTAWDNEKEKLDQLNEEKETLQSELNSLNDQMNSFEEEIAQKYPQIQEFLNAYNDAKDEYDNYKKEAISNAKSEVQSAQNYVNEIQTAINNYENKETARDYCFDGLTEVTKTAIELAFSQLGVYEDAGDNRGTMEKYGGGAGVPWCAAFVSWLFGEGQGNNSNNPLDFTASVSNLREQAKAEGYYSEVGSYTPVPGDIMIQKSNNSSHTGIVVATSGNIIYTIEGNSGDQVRLRSYEIGGENYQKISGWIRMNEWTGGSSDIPTDTYLAYANGSENADEISRSTY